MNKKKLILGIILFIAILSIIGIFYHFSFLFGRKITVENKSINGTEPISMQENNQIKAANEQDNMTQNNTTQDISQNLASGNQDNPERNKSDESDISIIQKPVNWGYQPSSSRKIDTIIIHSSYNALGGDPYSLDKLLEEYKQYGVSPHYLLNRSGVIYQLVQDKNIAYHAGEGQTPDGRTNVNNFSLGVEMINTEKDFCTTSQYKALNNLIAKLKKQYPIKYILGHNQIAPGRKSDPWNFDWSKISK